MHALRYQSGIVVIVVIVAQRCVVTPGHHGRPHGSTEVGALVEPLGSKAACIGEVRGDAAPGCASVRAHGDARRVVFVFRGVVGHHVQQPQREQSRRNVRSGGL
jgi:hypothetical protein